MSKLSDFLGADAPQFSDEELVVLRLMGRAFGRSMNLNFGEQPADALLEYLRSRAAGTKKGACDAAVPFLNAIGTLIADPGTEIPKAGDRLEPHVRRMTDRRRASLAFEIIRLLDDAEIEVPETTIRELSSAFNPGPSLTGAPLSVYWHLVLSRFAVTAIPDHKIAVCREMVAADTFIAGPLATVASARPHLFFASVAPLVFEALRMGELKEGDVVAPLKDAMREGFRGLYRSELAPARRQEQLKLLAGQIEVLLDAGGFEDVVESVVEGGALATHLGNAAYADPSQGAADMPFAALALVESGQSRGRANAHQIKTKDIEPILKEYVDPISYLVKDSVDPSLATNLIPYSEGIYFLIWRELLEQAGVHVELKYKEWGRVVKSFLDGELSFAVWNRYAPESKQHRGITVRLTTEPLIEYRDYPLVVRRAALVEIARKLPADGPEQTLLVDALTTGKSIAFPLFQRAHRLIEALRAAGLSYVGDSEIQDVAISALGNDVNGRLLTSDDAVERLVDGTLAGAFLGAVQASYLNHRFGAEAVTLTVAPHPSRVDLWFNEKTYAGRDYSLLKDPLLEAWKETRRLWEHASDEANKDPARDRLRDWIASLAYSLNYGVGHDRSRMRTPIRGWMQLADLKDGHDELDPEKMWSESVRSIVAASPNGGADRDTEVMPMNEVHQSFDADEAAAAAKPQLH
jgi:hypothetical protein